jgi:hypothetical protein
MTAGGFVRGISLLFVVLVVATQPCAARVVINELYYDHPGTDTGYEFVELHNASVLPADISGAALEFHNGTGTTWALVWRAPPGTVIAAQGMYLVGGELVSPLPDAVISYALQNGPDAIRVLASDGTVLDLVGYGGLDDPLFVETNGVAAVALGKSIARALDGVDSDDNAVDFVPASPTPGRHNVAREDAALALASGERLRAARNHAGTERIAVLIENRGLASIAAGQVSLVLSDSTADGAVTLAVGSNRGDIASGGTERISVGAAIGDGYHWLVISAHYPRDERDDNNRVQVLRRVGRIPVLVSEVWSAPREGCPQFVELMNAGAWPVDIAGFTLRDERARPVAIDTDSLLLAPGEWIAMTADVARLAMCAPDAPKTGLVGVRGAWPTFNRSGGASADSAFVFDREGIVVDVVTYPAMPASSVGRSLERVDLFLHDGPAVWRVSDAPGGCSPALANRAFIDRPAPSGTIVVSPNPFAPARGDVLRISMTPAPPVARVDAWVYDLEGHRLVALGGATSFPALLIWDGSGGNGVGVRAGLYLVAVEMFQADGMRLGVERVVVGCASGAVP